VDIGQNLYLPSFVGKPQSCETLYHRRHAYNHPETCGNYNLCW
jgi:hypothetical protein